MKKIMIALAVVVPAIEIALFYLIIQLIGIWATLFLMLATSAIGLILARKEGLNAIRLFRLQLSKGEPPTGVVLDGICIFIGGILLLLPGFLTDLFGFVLFVPFTRTIVKALVIKWMHHLFKKGQFVVVSRR
ncbi:FxsA family protein [Alkalicoccobacillus porphyridii]|nr:FxsA family protein [Alkalicoccobacillus porphyridii]